MNDRLQEVKIIQCFLCLSSGFGRKDVVDFLLQNGANVHARDDGGLISLHNACSFGHAEVPRPTSNLHPWNSVFSSNTFIVRCPDVSVKVVSLLLHHGADANARDNWNYTPLHEAAIKGKTDVCIGTNFRSLDTLLKFDILYICMQHSSEIEH